MKLLKYLLFLLILIVLGFSIYTYFTPPASPKGESTYTFNNKDYKVEYSRPFKKNRLIFGNKEDGALVPFNQYWRTGANFSTDITVSDSFYFGKTIYNLASPDASYNLLFGNNLTINGNATNFRNKE